MNKNNHNTSSCRHLAYNNKTNINLSPDYSGFTYKNKKTIFSPQNNSSQVVDEYKPPKLARHSSEQELFFSKRPRQRVKKL